MFIVYILFSENYLKTYTGYSSNFKGRLDSHNQFGKKDWATRYRPWQVLWLEEFSTKTEAMAREKFLKTGRGRELIYKWIVEKYGKEILERKQGS